MAEMKQCNITDLLGIERHPEYISHNEILWWMARSCLKPMPSVRDTIFNNNLMNIGSVNQFNGQRMFKDTDIKWYELSKEDQLMSLKDHVHKNQMALNEKRKREAENVESS
jgi:hypothetical protein